MGDGEGGREGYYPPAHPSWYWRAADSRPYERLWRRNLCPPLEGGWMPEGQTGGALNRELLPSRLCRATSLKREAKNKPPQEGAFLRVAHTLKRETLFGGKNEAIDLI